MGKTVDYAFHVPGGAPGVDVTPITPSEAQTAQALRVPGFYGGGTSAIFTQTGQSLNSSLGGMQRTGVLNPQITSPSELLRRTIANRQRLAGEAAAADEWTTEQKALGAAVILGVGYMLYKASRR